MTTDTHQTRLELVENLAQKWLDKPYCYKGTQMKITFPDPEQAAWKHERAVLSIGLRLGP